jgi:hypothetical protein
MTKPIRMHALDETDADVRKRHADIEKRLEEIGRSGVQSLLLSGGLPPGWNLIVHAWLAGDKLEAEDSGDD